MNAEHLIWFVCGVCVGVALSKQQEKTAITPEYEPSPVEREIAELLADETDIGAWYVEGDGMAGIQLAEQEPS